MRRINTPNKVADKFGAGKHGYKNGNKSLGVVATELDGDWFDSVQEEIANVIEGSGAALNPADNTQLATALSALSSATASQAEVDAGTVNNKSVSPLRLKNGFAISNTTNGYIKFPSWLGGLIIQWGAIAAGGSADGTQSLPLTFPTACLAAFSTSRGNGLFTVAIDALTTSTIAYYRRSTTTGSPVNDTSAARFLAIGN